jgi:hypothetical protein
MVRDHKLIIFFIPPEKIVNGGILSIFSICKVSREFKNVHHSDVVMSVYPDYKSYGKNDFFENDETIYSFEELAQKDPPSSLWLHVPEYASDEIFNGLKKYRKYLESVPDLRVNIMNQNIAFMPRPVDTAKWFALTPHITQTTAHDRYASQELADAYNIPTHHLSVFNDPEQYKWVPYEQKEDLIVFSPDVVDAKDAITEKLREHFPAYEFVTVQNMHYEDYKKLIGRAKFAVTFGEGFDGYYIEAFFSGGVTFAVYNDDFFPNKDFAKFENAFPSYESMLAGITKRMEELDNKSKYEHVNQQNLKKIKELYDFSVYKANLKKFYQGKVTFVPGEYSAERLIGAVAESRASDLAEKDKAIDERDRIIAEKEAEKVELINERERIVAEKNSLIADQERVIIGMVNSYSWKVTKPLRKTSSAVRKIKNRRKN